MNIAPRLESRAREAWYAMVTLGLGLNVALPLPADESSVVIDRLRGV